GSAAVAVGVKGFPQLGTPLPLAEQVSTPAKILALPPASACPSVPSSFTTSFAEFNDVTFAHDKAYAVGTFDDGCTFEALIVNYNPPPVLMAAQNICDGNPLPLCGRDNRLFGVSAVSPTDIWAVGDAGQLFVLKVPLIEHWDGTVFATL